MYARFGARKISDEDISVSREEQLLHAHSYILLLAGVDYLVTANPSLSLFDTL